MATLRLTRGLAISLGVFALAACGGPNPDKKPLPGPSASQSSDVPAVASEAAPSSDAASVAAGPDLDMDALADRQNPERLLHFYVEAVRAGAWKEAAMAWSSDAAVTPEKLQAAYGGHGQTNLVIGKGDTEGAAGTLFYVAPIVVDFADTTTGEPRGTITLRRVNDVPGASEQQLDWRIERSTVLDLKQ